MFRGILKLTITAAAVVGLVVTGCTPAAPASSAPSPPPTVITSTMSRPTWSVPAPTGMTQTQLYERAVVQYRQFFKMASDVETAGGAPQLPGSARQFLMQPAWSDVEKYYKDLYSSGVKYVGRPYFELQRVALDDSPDPPAGAVVGIRTCELVQGAQMFSRDGNVLYDGRPAIKSYHAHFKFDSDGQLKLFAISDGEVVDTCPFG